LKVLKFAVPFICPLADMCPPLTKRCQLVLHLRIRCKKRRLFLYIVQTHVLKSMWCSLHKVHAVGGSVICL
jgi:hypothetical protein